MYTCIVSTDIQWSIERYFSGLCDLKFVKFIYVEMN